MFRITDYVTGLKNDNVKGKYILKDSDSQSEDRVCVELKNIWSYVLLRIHQRTLTFESPHLFKI